MLQAMKRNDPNEYVEPYLKTYFKVSASEKRSRKSLLLTNYIVFANFVIPDRQKSVFQSVFECLSILKITKCKRTLLLELFGTNFPSEDLTIVLDLLNLSGIAVTSGVEFQIRYLEGFHLFFQDLEIPEPLSNEFPCLNYLKSASSFTSIDELQALNLTWDCKQSSIWSLMNKLEHNLELVRLAIACICYAAGCKIVEYVESYTTTIEGKQEYTKHEIVQFVNAKLLRDYNTKYYARLALICSLPEFSAKQYTLRNIFDGLEDTKLRFNLIDLWRLEYLGFVKVKCKDIYFMDSDLQIALRKNMLSLEDKSQAVKHLHKICFASKDGKRYDEVLKLA